MDIRITKNASNVTVLVTDSHFIIEVGKTGTCYKYMCSLAPSEIKRNLQLLASKIRWGIVTIVFELNDNDTHYKYECAISKENIDVELTTTVNFEFGQQICVRQNNRTA